MSVDSSGLRINRKSRWYSIRIHSNIVKKRDFRKLHLASEFRHKEKPIYSWELNTAIRRHDSPRFIKLLTRITGELGDVCGDKAYSSRKNAEIAVDRGGRPFLMPRNNASNRAKGHQAWKDMMKYRGKSIQEHLKTDTINEAMLLNQPTPHSKESLAISSIAESGKCRR